MTDLESTVNGQWRDDQSSTSPAKNAGMLNKQRLGLLPLTTVTSLAPLKMAVRVFRKIVLSLGSLHLTLMAVIGIWFWSSPALFESRQPGLSKPVTAQCASMALLGQDIHLSSSPLQTVSLVIYAIFAVPGLNLIVPAAVFLALHVVYHHLRPRDDGAKPSVVPVYIGLLFLLAVNVVFMVDIETTISHHDVSDESLWTFGQTLAVLLLVLPLRDVVMFIMHVRKEKRDEERRRRCTQDLKDALEDDEMDDVERMSQVKKAVKYADVRTEASGTLLVVHANYEG
jgi:hypothetical protein